MSVSTQSAVRNRLLALMSPDDFGLLAPHLARVILKKGFVMVEMNEPIEQVYFLDSGIASIIAISPEGMEVEAGLFGREGMGPNAVVLGADSTPNKVLLQVPDDAWRISTPLLRQALAASPTLHNLLLRFVQTQIVQTTYTALSNAVHPVDERLARWLLMCADRSDDSEFPLTHDFLSIMLAVRRPSVTTSLHVLEGNGFIRAERGCLTIRNRAALEQFAGDSYGRPEDAYRQLIGPMR